MLHVQALETPKFRVFSNSGGYMRVATDQEIEMAIHRHTLRDNILIFPVFLMHDLPQEDTLAPVLAYYNQQAMKRLSCCDHTVRECTTQGGTTSYSCVECDMLEVYSGTGKLSFEIDGSVTAVSVVSNIKQ